MGLRHPVSSVGDKEMSLSHECHNRAQLAGDEYLSLVASLSRFSKESLMEQMSVSHEYHQLWGGFD